MIRLGLIGLSEGNGHPYSWGAILNGYRPARMMQSGFPVIPKYLQRQRWPQSKISGASVTAIWTQHAALSAKIAGTVNIRHVCRRPQEMIGKVDGVLLARDDSHNHLKFAGPFLRAGVPIFIDKPIATNLHDLEMLYAQQVYDGQIFSCSALRFSPELCLNSSLRLEIGEVVEVLATGPKSWSRYAVHLIEPTLELLGIENKLDSISAIRSVKVSGSPQSTDMAVSWTSGQKSQFLTTGRIGTPFHFQVNGTKGSTLLTFNNPFSAFKGALEEFLKQMTSSTSKDEFHRHQLVVRLIEEGGKKSQKY